MKAEELIDLYLSETVDPIEPIKPRRRTLAQKQGARKAGRTRSRKLYTEITGKGFLYYNYYTPTQTELQSREDELRLKAERDKNRDD